jgi:hypothetical protein
MKTRKKISKKTPKKINISKLGQGLRTLRARWYKHYNLMEGKIEIIIKVNSQIN